MATAKGLRLLLTQATELRVLRWGALHCPRPYLMRCRVLTLCSFKVAAQPATAQHGARLLRCCRSFATRTTRRAAGSWRLLQRQSPLHSSSSWSGLKPMRAAPGALPVAVRASGCCSPSYLPMRLRRPRLTSQLRLTLQCFKVCLLLPWRAVVSYALTFHCPQRYRRSCWMTLPARCVLLLPPLCRKASQTGSNLHIALTSLSSSGSHTRPAICAWLRSAPRMRANGSGARRHACLTPCLAREAQLLRRYIARTCCRVTWRN